MTIGESGSTNIARVIGLNTTVAVVDDPLLCNSLYSNGLSYGHIQRNEVS